MAIKNYNPTSPGRRGMSGQTFQEITKCKPLKSLLTKKKRISGRNNQGRITVFHRGGGAKKLYRIIDFARDKYGISGKVSTIEYDPNRNARIALIVYSDGEKRYIIAPKGLEVGSKVISDESTELKVGNALPIKNIPTGTLLHNVELRPKKGGQIARAAGSSVVLQAKEKKYALLKLKSGEIRKVLLECRATVGEVGNAEYSLLKFGKAGRKRWKGIRPTVRGVAMNPVDHPHGGGEGKTSGGRHPSTPWGKSTKGLKTRKNKRSQVFIYQRRK